MAALTWNKVFIVMAASWCLAAAQDLATCTHNGVVYNEGESITGDPCDLCQCTQFGIMCQLLQCKPALCVDKYTPSGECCEVCPGDKVTCLYNGPQGTVIVPETGCQYGTNEECFCYYANGDPAQMRTYCLPPLPFLYYHRGELSPCNSTDSGSRNSFVKL